MIKLSTRLQAICDMTESGSRICDVGCDHAYVDIRLLQEGKITSALAMDVAPGPLGKAGENLKLTELADRCELRISDGLAAFAPGEADTMICAGMGGILMRSILEAQPQKALSFRQLILSPHTEIELVREWLVEHRCCIVDEVFLADEGKYYTVIKAEPPAKCAAASVSAGEEDALAAGDSGEKCAASERVEGVQPPAAGAAKRAFRGAPYPDWDACAAMVRALSEEEAAAAMVDRAAILRLLEDDGFCSYVQNRFGPCVLSRFLVPDSGGGATQETFRQFLTAELRSTLALAERLAEAPDSDSAQNRLQQLGGEIGILQVLLFLYSFRGRIGQIRPS